MNHAAWRMGFHIMPAIGWLNDPNGLCQFRGVYHVFHQASPAWPDPDAPRGWGHLTSTDLVRWEQHGMAIEPDTPADASGSYSGSAVVVPGEAADGGDALRLYFTGNVLEPGDHDYVLSGRQANEILVTSDDGFALSPKRVLLRSSDYPAICSCHVRDPRVWRQDGAWWMLLGARDRASTGMALIYRSTDGLAWTHHATVHSEECFGYMWECPDHVVLDGHEYLAFCPQGMEGYPWANGIRDQAGYIPLDEGERLVDVTSVRADRFERWDKGFDFYAPQTFTDDVGRVILIGWMGLPEPPFGSAPEGLAWCHCLTVPRLLGRDADGRITQRPVPELEQLRDAEVVLEAACTAPDAPPTRCASLDEHRFDLVLEGIEGAGAVELDGGAVRISWGDGALTLAFASDLPGSAVVASGRTTRTCAASAVGDLRVLVDSSAIEIFAHGGREVLATRWFPVDERARLTVRGQVASAHLWHMGDGMRGTYDD